MTPSKVYSNKRLFEVFSAVVVGAEGHLTTSAVKEAIRIRKRGLNPDSVCKLAGLGEDDLNQILSTVRLAEEVAKTTNVVPNLCDL